MKPGRELDKLVAEAVGQKRIGDCPLGDRNCDGVYEPQLWHNRCLPPFSTDIAAAWIAWEWLEKNHGSVCLTESGKMKPSVCVIEWDELVEPPLAEGETYPHAICLAVLEASKAKK